MGLVLAIALGIVFAYLIIQVGLPLVIGVGYFLWAVLVGIYSAFALLFRFIFYVCGFTKKKPFEDF